MISWQEFFSFFVYDSVKIMLLLFIMIAIVGVLRSYLAPEKIRIWLKGKWSYFAASAFGALTPFCSCSSIPLFIGFLEAGVPLGVSFSFLTTSPLVNEYLVVLMFGFFGWKVALAYVLIGMLIGITTGFVVSRLDLQKYVVKDFKTSRSSERSFVGFRSRLLFGLSEAVSIVKKLWLWILIGVGVGALIHNFVPADFVNSVVSSSGLFGVPAAVLLGVPLYGSCAAVVPVAFALFELGFPLGTSLAFMMAMSALSIPEAVILRRVMRIRLILVFFSVVAVSIVLIGYIVNALQNFII